MIKKNVIIVATLAIAAVMIVVVFAAITSIRTIPTSGTISGVNLEVYSDIDLAPAHILDIDHPFGWGTVDPQGSPVTKTIYIVNKGTTDMTLSMITENWVNQHSMTLAWNQTGATVSPYVDASDIVTALLTLTPDPAFLTGGIFSVNIKITGTT